VVFRLLDAGSLLDAEATRHPLVVDLDRCVPVSGGNPEFEAVALLREERLLDLDGHVLRDAGVERRAPDPGAKGVVLTDGVQFDRTRLGEADPRDRDCGGVDGPLPAEPVRDDVDTPGIALPDGDLLGPSLVELVDEHRLRCGVERPVHVVAVERDPHRRVLGELPPVVGVDGDGEAGLRPGVDGPVPDGLARPGPVVGVDDDVPGTPLGHVHRLDEEVPVVAHLIVHVDVVAVGGDGADPNCEDGERGEQDGDGPAHVPERSE